MSTPEATHQEIKATLKFRLYLWSIALSLLFCAIIYFGLPYISTYMSNGIDGVKLYMRTPEYSSYSPTFGSAFFFMASIFAAFGFLLNLSWAANLVENLKPRQKICGIIAMSPVGLLLGYGVACGFFIGIMLAICAFKLFEDLTGNLIERIGNHIDAAYAAAFNFIFYDVFNWKPLQAMVWFFETPERALITIGTVGVILFGVGYRCIKGAFSNYEKSDPKEV